MKIEKVTSIPKRRVVFAEVYDAISELEIGESLKVSGLTSKQTDSLRSRMYTNYKKGDYVASAKKDEHGNKNFYYTRLK